MDMFRLTTALAGVWLLTACASAPPQDGPEKVVGKADVEQMSALPEDPTAGSGAIIMPDSDYVLGPADELEISVFQVEELSGTERIDSRGYIVMPLLGQVKVAGLTREQAEDLLAQLYEAEYLQDPQVNIDIIDYASRRVTVMGSVEKPDVYPLKGQTTLLEALAMAGGLERLADESSIVVFRTNANGEVIGYIVDMNLITSGEKVDPEVTANDTIVVPQSGSKTFVKNVTDTLRGFVGFATY
jgi:polysaccharide export outer membrane protein